MCPAKFLICCARLFPFISKYFLDFTFDFIVYVLSFRYIFLHVQEFQFFFLCFNFTSPSRLKTSSASSVAQLVLLFMALALISQHARLPRPPHQLPELENILCINCFPFSFVSFFMADMVCPEGCICCC